MANIIKRNNALSFFDDFFDDFFTPNKRNQSCMKTDILDKDNEYELQIDVPGFSKEDIKISLDNGYLTVEAQVEKTQENKNTHYLKRERYVGASARSFYVGEDISEEDIQANYDKGMLKLTVPKQGTNVKEKKYIEIQ
ncbi:MAG: Hsp20/alpha crystallin family protein [Candidatus Izemoplasmatales bacterium]|uniref:Hsp20/alpha crystallin family protein n=1 Tax=Hujiaoplasma nucleasis TaxID=2725268 RepID=A0A7L6N5D0_9MOLU|nr:Hsp20/alpha crystallin family protein [Hujiaoplasma nucleasis]QLY39779.1 Hsp20/alpha crystallin family protein [Hujiaoplasma nucleasis]